MPMKWSTTGFAAGAAAMMLSSAAIAADPRGDWLTEDHDARIRIAHCGTRCADASSRCAKPAILRPGGRRPTRTIAIRGCASAHCSA